MSSVSRQNILILSAGRRVELVQAFQAECRKRLPDAFVGALDLKPELSSACQVAAKQYAGPRVSDPGYVQFLADLCAQESIGLVVPTIDTELLVLSQNKDRFAQSGTTLVVSNTDLISQCRDKRRTADVFNMLDIGTPKIFDRNAIIFPCFAKPYDGSSGIDASRIEAEADITKAMDANTRMMFMELVDIVNYKEFTVDAYFDRGGTLKSMVPRERIETRAGEISKGITRRGDLSTWLRPKLAGLNGAIGCITLQLFANADFTDFKAIEINPRFGGGYPLSYAAGANFPGWLIDEYLLGVAPEFSDDWESDLLMLRYDAKVLVHGHN
jgi:carbamoyl-phosphate synthase large subunit